MEEKGANERSSTTGPRRTRQHFQSPGTVSLITFPCTVMLIFSWCKQKDAHWFSVDNFSPLFRKSFWQQEGKLRTQKDTDHKLGQTGKSQQRVQMRVYETELPEEG